MAAGVREGQMPGSEKSRHWGQRGIDTRVRWTPGSERDGCQGQRGADARVREGRTLGSEGADARVREEGTPGSERDGCWGQRGMDTGVLGCNICAEKGMTMKRPQKRVWWQELSGFPNLPPVAAIKVRLPHVGLTTAP